MWLLKNLFLFDLLLTAVRWHFIETQVHRKGKKPSNVRRAAGCVLYFPEATHLHPVLGKFKDVKIYLT